MSQSVKVLSCLIAFAILGGAAPAQSADPVVEGVYEYVVRNSELPLDDAVAALEHGLAQGPLALAAAMDASSPADCGYRSKVFVVWDAEYAAKLSLANAQTAPFAMTLRINLFEDEAGVHASIVNPSNINRTVLMNDEDHRGLSGEMREDLRRAIQAAIPGEQDEEAYGPMRKKGYIGKTMGVMAGGPFEGKLQEITVVPNGDFDATLEKLRSRIGDEDGKWGLHPAYDVIVEPGNLAIIGLTGAPVEQKSFTIVKNGQDSSRSKFECPGIDHAAAYPLEIVLLRDGDDLRIRTVESMYRMKMYFEDAGKWAFMKNMGMPGSIRDEIAARVQHAVAN